MRKISQIQYKRFGDSFIPYRKTILSLIDDHMYLMQSYKYDLVSDAWLQHTMMRIELSGMA